MPFRLSSRISVSAILAIVLMGAYPCSVRGNGYEYHGHLIRTIKLGSIGSLTSDVADKAVQNLAREAARERHQKMIRLMVAVAGGSFLVLTSLVMILVYRRRRKNRSAGLEN